MTHIIDNFFEFIIPYPHKMRPSDPAKHVLYQKTEENSQQVG